MDKQRKRQFEIIDKVNEAVRKWADEQEIPVHAIEIVVPFVDTDFSLDVVIFFKNNADLRGAEATLIPTIKDKYLNTLETFDYPHEWLDLVMFYFDTDENVQRDYGGSYFDRMR